MENKELTEEEKERYKRQIIIPGWGESVQKKLKSSKVFIAGAGGLGSPLAINLAIAGVGTLRICDYQSLELSNLNRQFLHDDERIGMNKAESAEITLKRLNPYIEVEPLMEKINEENINKLVRDSDIIIDCLDNFPTRFILNELAIRKGIPMVHGSIWGLEGMVTFIHSPETPCLRCIFLESPPTEVFPVVGPTPGIIGTIQAMETIKYLLSIGKLLKGRLLRADFEEMKFFEIKIKKFPTCPTCGSNKIKR